MCVCLCAIPAFVFSAFCWTKSQVSQIIILTLLWYEVKTFQVAFCVCDKQKWSKSPAETRQIGATSPVSNRGSRGTERGVGRAGNFSSGYWHQQTEQRGGWRFRLVTLFRTYCSSVLYTGYHTVIPVTLRSVSMSAYGQVLLCRAKPQHKFHFFSFKLREKKESNV